MGTTNLRDVIKKDVVDTSVQLALQNHPEWDEKAARDFVDEADAQGYFEQEVQQQMDSFETEVLKKDHKKGILGKILWGVANALVSVLISYVSVSYAEKKISVLVVLLALAVSVAINAAQQVKNL